MVKHIYANRKGLVYSKERGKEVREAKVANPNRELPDVVPNVGRAVCHL